MPAIEVDCDTADRVPIFVVRINRASANTFIVMRVDLGAALLFDGELPLGMIRFNSGGDSLWAAIRLVLVNDPRFNGPQPESRFEPSGAIAGEARPPAIPVEGLPSAIERVSPDYPEDARRDQLYGTVWIKALVGKDRHVHDAVCFVGARATAGSGAGRHLAVAIHAGAHRWEALDGMGFDPGSVLAHQLSS